VGVLSLDTLRLKCAELGNVLVEAAVETGFLEMEILQRLFVFEKVLDIARSSRSFFGLCSGR